VISQFLRFANQLILCDMKAVRIKTSDQHVDLIRFEMVLLKNIVSHNLYYQMTNKEGFIKLELRQGEPFLLSLPCDEKDFNIFKLRWEIFQENENYYFDLSEWRLVK
jgi:hypothetical protein